MNIYQYPNLAIKHTKERLLSHGWKQQQKTWQSVESPDDTWELFNHSLAFFIPRNLGELRDEIKPNIPWADDHFFERIGGKPLNPGDQYRNWPYYKANPKNDKFRTVDKKFSHSYMERIWPIYAGDKENFGIRFRYGDFSDVIALLQKDPSTRQAYLPIFFPEDTGVVHGERVPCTLGYHFIYREGFLHVVYYIRSCDYIRHFRDDIYLACRKVFHILDTLKDLKKSEFDWSKVRPGTLTMHITSLHVFNNEKHILRNDKF